MKCEFPKNKWKLFQNGKLAFGFQIILSPKLLHTCTCVALLFGNVMVQKSFQTNTICDYSDFPKKSQICFHIK
jgi:hypothetical protein